MRAARWLARFVCAAAGTMALSSSSFAQQPFDFQSPAPSPPAIGGTEQAVVPRYWELGRTRPFLAAIVEGGYAYLRPRFSLGYGQPYWRWIGLETYPLLSLSGIGHYAGIGAALPGITARIGGRYSYSFSQYLLQPREHFSRLDLQRVDAPKQKYLALEAELAGTIPVFVGSAFAVLTAYRIQGVDAGYFVYEETLRQIMDPPWIWRARLGYLVGLGREQAIRVGVAGEVIGMPGRDATVVRAGVLASVLINAHLEAQASIIPAIVSPDRLGLAGGDFGQLGVRLRWATDSAPDPARVRQVLSEKLEQQSPAER